MKTYIWRSCIAAFALVASHANGEAADKTNGEKIRDVSPDGKFAMRISYDEKENEHRAAEAKDQPGEHPLADGMFSAAITAIDLISLPSKEKVAQLLPSNSLGDNFGDLTLIWSADSHWCAFYDSELGTGYTSVFKEQEGKFVKLGDQDNLRASFKGDVRNEWVTPIKWIKPGVLVLEHKAIARDGEKDWRFEITVSFDAGGKVHVISQKKLKPKPM